MLTWEDLQASLAVAGLKDDEISTMMMADHGLVLYGNAIMVNPEFAKANPKVVAGFSDITALLCWAWVRAGLPSVHVPTTVHCDHLIQAHVDGPTDLLAAIRRVIHGDDGAFDSVALKARVAGEHQLLNAPGHGALTGGLVDGAALSRPVRLRDRVPVPPPVPTAAIGLAVAAAGTAIAILRNRAHHQPAPPPSNMARAVAVAAALGPTLKRSLQSLPTPKR